MQEPRQQERNFELRSEKVRSIVGQIPSSLVRYGSGAIGIVLLCLAAVAYYLPYQQVYSGTATLYEAPSPSPLEADSLTSSLWLRFEGKRLPKLQAPQSIIFINAEGEALSGQILSLSPKRDTLERQEALCQLSSTERHKLHGQTVDFRLTLSSGNLLSYLLGRLRP